MTTTLQFLHALYPDPVSPGQLVVWTSSRRGGKKHAYWVHTLDQAADHAHRLKTSRDVHFSVALHDPIKARAIVRRRWPKVQLPSVRGSHDSAVALPALWAEIGFAGPGDARTTLPPDLASATGLLKVVRVPPSIIVDTGSGLQVYWLLRELWLLDTDEQRIRARDLLRRLQGALQAAARLEGWTIDGAGDLAGMPRVPGTLNLESAKARPVSITHFPLHPATAEARYSPEDFDDLPPAPEPAPAISRPQREQREDPVLACFEPMFDGCRFLQDCYREQDRIDEQKWLAALGMVGRTESEGLDRGGLAHDFSRGHPGYNPLKTEEMLEHAVRDLDPRTCVEIEEAFDAGGRLCGRCPNRGKVENPIVLGQVDPRRSSAPDPESDLATPATPADSGSGDDGGDGDEGADGITPVTIVVNTREHAVGDRALAALANRERAGVLVYVALTGFGPDSVRPWVSEQRKGPRPGHRARRRSESAAARPAGTDAGVEQGVVNDLVHGLAELLQPLGGAATAREILDQLARSDDDFPTLRTALRDLFPRLESGQLPRSTQLAGRLRAHRGRVVRGACIDQASKSYKGALWTVRRAA